MHREWLFAVLSGGSCKECQRLGLICGDGHGPLPFGIEIDNHLWF